jgi:hypothetical protein
VPAEAAFSFASQIVMKLRNRLSGETVRYIMCLHDWGQCSAGRGDGVPDNHGDARGISEKRDTTPAIV